MNAIKYLGDSDRASKIIATVNLFTSQFPSLLADLKPSQQQILSSNRRGVDTIDIAFHFPGTSIPCQCNTIILRICFYCHPDYEEPYFLGIEVMGYSQNVRLWEYSTVGYAQFSGIKTPALSAQFQLKSIFDEIFRIFSN